MLHKQPTGDSVVERTNSDALDANVCGAGARQPAGSRCNT